MDQFKAALVEEATRRSGVIWISVPGAGPPRPAWHIWHAGCARPAAGLPHGRPGDKRGGRPGDEPGQDRSGAAYVVTGDNEQLLPGLGNARQVTVTVPSKDSRGQLITWTAQVSRVVPGGDEWAEVAGLLAARRRGGAEPPASLPERWAARADVFRLSPVETGPYVAGRPTSYDS